MRVIWANQSYPTLFDDLKDVIKYYTHNSIFLAGPTPRSSDVKSWRPEALEILEGFGYDGLVFVPEPEDGVFNHDYVDQVEWEELGLGLSGCIVFWIPRDLDGMPGFTTNVEWGRWGDSGKAVLGAPEGAPKMKYLKYYAKKNDVIFATSLRETLHNAIVALRSQYEC